MHSFISYVFLLNNNKTAGDSPAYSVRSIPTHFRFVIFLHFPIVLLWDGGVPLLNSVLEDWVWSGKGFINKIKVAPNVFVTLLNAG